ncbi:TRAF3-interacting JNK-activating modulator isoform X2 [Varanus komodoensis]|uniref:TRAF3-interacting JNK-activating modulator isoform X2 n=1 Tax=Varanus komodoensis TaxID=61221 RepID=UPI001CF7DC43|nr:TRAF3-interacting JNK-activating modulator isoform X2 [Varanus komodoensis]
MITGSGKSRCPHRPQYESYEEKYERRQEKRGNIRRRNNTTMCHLVGKNKRKEAKEPLQSPRQKEFLRRRNLVTEELKGAEVCMSSGIEASLVSENRTGDVGERSSWTNLRLSPTNQETLNNPTAQFLTQFVLCESYNTFADGNLDSSPKSMLTVKVSKSCKGTQTTTESSAEKKNSGQQTDCGITVLDKEIIQLSNYLKEALHREIVLKQKMVILQELLTMLLKAAEQSWKGQLNEDKLKCRLGALENQLQICSENYSKKNLKKIILEMEDQKKNYEHKAKESLQKLLEEKLQAEKQLQNAQRALTVADEDLTLWKEHYNALKNNWSQLMDKHSELENKLHVLEDKLKWSDTQNSQLDQSLQNLESERASLYSRIDHLQEDNRFIMECLNAAEGKLQNEERQKLALEATIKHFCKPSRVTTENQVLSSARAIQNSQPEDHEVGRGSTLDDQAQTRITPFTAKEKERQHDQWIPVLMVIIATALVSYLVNFRP